MVNAKQAAGRARKAEQAEKKADVERQKQAAKEDAEWSKGAKTKDSKADKQAAAEEAKRKKAERDRLLAEEEASLPSKKSSAAPKAGSQAKKNSSAKPQTSRGSAVPSFDDALAGGSDEPTSFSASGIDDALDMLSLVTAKSDKAAVGSQAAKIDTHPERRFKAAFEAYKERELPKMKLDYPGLRLQQYNDRLHEAFKKSPQNPFNQAHMSYDSTKADKVAALQAQKDEISRRLRDS
ncbi:hypothetical protein ACM66B_000253 [Microbotryomycetes sp. NB124-2]